MIHARESSLASSLSYRPALALPDVPEKFERTLMLEKPLKPVFVPPAPSRNLATPARSPILSIALCQHASASFLAFSG
jgi:hypothetical protein